MKLLLDTHALIWWLDDAPRLGAAARALIADPANHIYVSTVSLWEITIKWRVGKFQHSGSHFAVLLEGQGLDMLSVTPDHVARLDGLAFHHGDPFDHLLLAQAQHERLAIVTADKQMTRYGVPCVNAAT